MKRTREKLCGAKRVVVKVGSRVLVDESGKPDHARMFALAAGVAAGHAQGREMALVSSGAIAAGMEALHIKERPVELPELQMAAAVGQTRLMSVYGHLFGQKKIHVGQVLLTDDLLKVPVRCENARNTLQHLIQRRIIPVINENDTVATEEIRFGDNDLLAVLVARLIDADALILLTTSDGVQDAAGHRLPFIERVTEGILALDRGKNGQLSTGGMRSKLLAAAQAAEAGIPVAIADGRVDGVIEALLAGEDTGTLIRNAS